MDARLRKLGDLSQVAFRSSVRSGFTPRPPPTLPLANRVLCFLTESPGLTCTFSRRENILRTPCFAPFVINHQYSFRPQNRIKNKTKIRQNHVSGGRQYICSCLAGARLGFPISISLRPCCLAGWTAPSSQTDSFPPCTKTRAGVSRLEFSQAWVVRVLVSIQMDQAKRCQGSGVAMPVTTNRGRPASSHQITSARISPPVLRLWLEVRWWV